MDPCEFQNELGDILRKTEVILCVLYRHCGNANLYFRKKYLFICHLEEKNGGRLVTEKPFTSKWKMEM